MAWVMPAFQLGASLFGASRARRDARRAQQQQMQMQERQIGLFQDQMNFGRDRLNQFDQRFNPIFDQLSDMAQDDRVDYSGVVGDATAAYDSSINQARRQSARYGINPSDGAAGDMEARAGLARAGSIVNAMNQQRMGAADRRWQRTGQLASLTMPLLGSATGIIGQGVAGLGSALGGAAGNAANQAANAGNAYGAAMGGAGMAFGQLGEAFFNRPTPAPIPISGVQPGVGKSMGSGRKNQWVEALDSATDIPLLRGQAGMGMQGGVSGVNAFQMR